MDESVLKADLAVIMATREGHTTASAISEATGYSLATVYESAKRLYLQLDSYTTTNTTIALLVLLDYYNELGLSYVEETYGISKRAVNRLVRRHKLPNVRSIHFFKPYRKRLDMAVELYLDGGYSFTYIKRNTGLDANRVYAELERRGQQWKTTKLKLS